MRFGKLKTLALVLAGYAAIFLIWSLWPLRQPVTSLAATRILDRNGGVLYEVPHPEFGVVDEVAFSDIPPSMRQAVLAAEDAEFYKHHGVDWSSFVRAVVMFQWRGVSTIEQQVVKMVYYPDKPRTVLQKAREVVGSIVWAGTQSKEETLTTYLNRAYFGQRAYGVASAARTYFNKSAHDITLGEAAMLAAILPAPARYEPYQHWDEAKARQRVVLDTLVALGWISQQARDEADAEDLVIARPRFDDPAPHFVRQVLSTLEAQYPDIETSGYTITTTIDPALQAKAEHSISRRLADLRNQRVGNAAVVALDPLRGDILAYVGSADFYNDAIDGQVDMVQAQRQPGSALKPFLYYTSFLHGFNPATVIADLPVRYQTADGSAYYPRNYGYGYAGPVSIRDALGSSLNVPAVKVLDRLGLPAFFTSLEKFGLTFEKPPDFYGLGIVLGGGEVTLEDTAAAYGALAQYGRPVHPRSVLRIVDANGVVLLSANDYPAVAHGSLQEQQAAALLADVLSDPTARIRSFGEANALDVGKRIAVKTGTTKDFRDNWAFGYTPEFVLGVWVGNADNTPMEGVSGITGAVPIWHDIMLATFGGGPEIIWPEPDGFIRKQICITSGLLASEDCPKQRLERFMPGTEPTQTDDWYKRIAIDCQPTVVERVFLIVPAEYHGWSLAAGHEQPPRFDCYGREVSATAAETVILSPLNGDVFAFDPHLDPYFQRIPFMAGGEGPYRWTLNGRVIESSSATYLWDPIPGEFILELANRQVRFTVQ